MAAFLLIRKSHRLKNRRQVLKKFCGLPRWALQVERVTVSRRHHQKILEILFQVLNQPPCLYIRKNYKFLLEISNVENCFLFFFLYVRTYPRLCTFSPETQSNLENFWSNSGRQVEQIAKKSSTYITKSPTCGRFYKN